MVRHALALSIAMMTLTPVALAGDCTCSDKCMTECKDGKGEHCKCEDCGCKDGKCSHGKCAHEPKHKDKK